MRSWPAWLVFLAVASPAVSAVAVDRNPAVDMSAYRTYAWKPGTPAKHASAEECIVRAVNRELQAKGLVFVGEGADVYVSTHTIVDTHTLEQLADPTDWEFWTGVKSFDAYDLAAGTLVVDLEDARLDKIVWRGLATATVDGPLDKVEKKISKMVRKMFKSF